MVRINVPSRPVGGGNPNVPDVVSGAQEEYRRAQNTQQAVLDAGKTIAGIVDQVRRERQAERAKMSEEQSASAIGDLNAFVVEQQQGLTREDLTNPDNLGSEESVLGFAQERFRAVQSKRDELASSIEDEDARQGFINQTNENMGRIFQERFAGQALKMFDASQADAADAEVDELANSVFVNNSPGVLRAALNKARKDPRLSSRDRDFAVRRVRDAAYSWYSSQLRGEDGFDAAQSILANPAAVAETVGASTGNILARAEEVVIKHWSPGGSGDTLNLKALRDAQDLELLEPGSFEAAAEKALEQIEQSEAHMPESMRGRFDKVKVEIEQTRAEIAQARDIASALAAGTPFPVNKNTRVGRLAANMDWFATLDKVQGEADLAKRASLITTHWNMVGASEGSLGYVLSLDPVYDQQDALVLGALSDGLGRISSPRRAEVGHAVVNAMRKYGEDAQIVRMVEAIDPDAARQLQQRVGSGAGRVTDTDALAILADRGNLLDAQKLMLGGVGRAKSMELDVDASLQQKELPVQGDLVDRVARDMVGRTKAWLDDADLHLPSDVLIAAGSIVSDEQVPDGHFTNGGGEQELAEEVGKLIAPNVIANYSATSLSYDNAVSMTMAEHLSTATYSQFRRGKAALDAPEHYFPAAWSLFKLETKVGALKSQNVDYMKVIDFEAAGTGVDGAPYYNIWLEGDAGPVMLMDEKTNRPYAFSLADAEVRLTELGPLYRGQEERSKLLGSKILGTVDEAVSRSFDNRKAGHLRKLIVNEPGSLRTEAQSEALDKQLLDGAYPMGGSLKPVMTLAETQLEKGRRPTRQSRLGDFDDPAPADIDWPADFRDQKLEKKLRKVVASIGTRAEEADGYLTVTDTDVVALQQFTRAMRAGSIEKGRRYRRALDGYVEKGELTQKQADDLMATYQSRSSEFISDLDFTEQQLQRSFDFFTIHRAFDSQKELGKQVRAATLVGDYLGYRRALGLGAPLRTDDNGNVRVPTKKELDDEVAEWIRRGGLIDWRGIRGQQP